MNGCLRRWLCRDVYKRQYQHGEVYVTEDGTETDLDLGHYERFIDEDLNRYSLSLIHICKHYTPVPAYCQEKNASFCKEIQKIARKHKKLAKRG